MLPWSQRSPAAWRSLFSRFRRTMPTSLRATRRTSRRAAAWFTTKASPSTRSRRRFISACWSLLQPLASDFVTVYRALCAVVVAAVLVLFAWRAWGRSLHHGVLSRPDARVPVRRVLDRRRPGDCRSCCAHARRSRSSRSTMNATQAEIVALAALAVLDPLRRRAVRRRRSAGTSRGAIAARRAFAWRSLPALSS